MTKPPISKLSPRRRRVAALIDPAALGRESRNHIRAVSGIVDRFLRRIDFVESELAATKFHLQMAETSLAAEKSAHQAKIRAAERAERRELANRQRAETTIAKLRSELAAASKVPAPRRTFQAPSAEASLAEMELEVRRRKAGRLREAQDLVVLAREAAREARES